MKEEQYSITAEASAVMRAAGTYEKEQALRSPDYLAEKLVGTKYQCILKFSPIRNIALRYAEWKFPGLYEGHLSRTHHYDRVVREELEKGVKQYVILGAGLDSRPYRIANQYKDCKVFEVDHPATGGFKKEKLRRAGIESNQVTYVPVDFTKERAIDRLLEEGFQKDLPALFTWEGVIMYLNEEIVTDMLRFVASLPQGSSILFDYFFADVITNPEKFPEAPEQMAYVEKIQEPYTFGINHEDMKPFVLERGLQLASNLGPDDLTNNYLKGHHRGVVAWYGVAHARVP